MKPSDGDIAASAARLRSSGWLAETPVEFQNALLARTIWQGFVAGETISHGGDINGGIFGLASGAVSILPVIGPPDAPAIHIAAPPFWYGSNPLVERRPRIISVIARSESVVALVPQHALEVLLAERPEWWRSISVLVSGLAALASQIAADLLIRDSRRRCVAVLLRVAATRDGGDAPAVAELGQDELAAMATMSRQTAGPILHGLADAGLITAGYRSITLHDPAGLRAILHG